MVYIHIVDGVHVHNIVYTYNLKQVTCTSTVVKYLSSVVQHVALTDV